MQYQHIPFDAKFYAESEFWRKFDLKNFGFTESEIKFEVIWCAYMIYRCFTFRIKQNWKCSKNRKSPIWPNQKSSRGFFMLILMMVKLLEILHFLRYFCLSEFCLHQTFCRNSKVLHFLGIKSEIYQLAVFLLRFYSKSRKLGSYLRRIISTNISYSKNIRWKIHLVVLRGLLIALIGLGPLEEYMNPLSFGFQPIALMTSQTFVHLAFE